MKRVLKAGVACVAMACGSAWAEPPTCTTEAVSVQKLPEDVAPGSTNETMTPDGRFVAFASQSRDLGVPFSGEVSIIYVQDRQTGVTDAVSLRADGGLPSDACYYPSISDDGRMVSFSSRAADLVAGDTNDDSDIFVFDRELRTMRRIGPAWGEPNGESSRSSVSGNGRYVALESFASNLTSGYDGNGYSDIYRADLETGQIDLVSSTCGYSWYAVYQFGSSYWYSYYANGSFWPSISFDGRKVGFVSTALDAACSPIKLDSWPDVYVRDMETGVTTTASTDAFGEFVPDTVNWYGSMYTEKSSFRPALSGDGRYVAFSSWQNLVAGLSREQGANYFRKDLATGGVDVVDASASILFGPAVPGLPSVSTDGRYVQFESVESMLFSNSYSPRRTYKRDMVGGTSTRVSVDEWYQLEASGQNLTGRCISENGEKSLYSTASPMDPGDLNGDFDAYWFDSGAGVRELAVKEFRRATGNRGSYAPSIGGFGRYVNFMSTATDVYSSNRFRYGYPYFVSDSFVRDLESQRTVGIVENINEYGPFGVSGATASRINRFGDFVAFQTQDNEFPIDNRYRDDNAFDDVYVVRLADTSVTRVSIAAAGGTDTNGPSAYPDICGDGRFVVFESAARNLIATDTNNRWDIFRRDMNSTAMIRVSRSSLGSQGNGDSFDARVSDTGQFVAYVSLATNLVAGDTNQQADVFTFDVQTGQTRRVQAAGVQPNGSSYSPSISGDGNLIAVESDATNLVGADTNDSTDVFVFDRSTGAIVMISKGWDGGQADGPSYRPRISSDGSTVVFESLAANLVPGDTNGFLDVFAADLASGRVTRLSVAEDGTEGNGDSYNAAVNDDGVVVAFQTDASNLVSDDTNFSSDVIVRRRDCEVYCPADVNRDRVVDFGDFLEFFNCFDSGTHCADLGGEPGVDFGDFLAFFNGFDGGC
jgi:hypothetical protein